MTKKYKLIIFDLIDTLAYCEGLSEQSMHLEEVLSKDVINRFVDGGNIDKLRSVDEALAKFRAIAPLSAEQELLVREWLSWSQNYLFNDSIEVLKYLKNEGYKVAVISNSPPTTRDQLLDLGIKEYIDVVAFSFEVDARKPEKEIFLSVLAKTNIEPSEALMVGDSLKNDINGAHAVGIDSLLLDRNDTISYAPKITTLLQLKEFLETTES